MTAIGLWENKADAEAYNANTSASAEDGGKIHRGTPKVQTSDVVNSTFHKSAVLLTA